MNLITGRSGARIRARDRPNDPTRREKRSISFFSLLMPGSTVAPRPRVEGWPLGRPQTVNSDANLNPWTDRDDQLVAGDCDLRVVALQKHRRVGIIRAVDLVVFATTLGKF